MLHDALIIKCKIEPGLARLLWSIAVSYWSRSGHASCTHTFMYSCLCFVLIGLKLGHQLLGHTIKDG